MSDRRLAILIASSKFQEDDLHDLRCPENDVEGLSEVLKSPEIGGFQELHVLTNQPSQPVKMTIEGVLGGAKENDLVLIYYSGHGKISATEQLCLTMTDTDLNLLDSTSIRISDIRDFIKGSRCKSVVLMLDCCFSGLAGEAFVRVRGSARDELHLASKDSGLFIMTASTKIQRAQEKEKDQYGVFTKHIIGGLQSGEADFDGDGKICIVELYDYVHEKVLSEGFQEPMRWDIGVKGKLIVAKTGRDPRSEWAQKVRDMLFGHYKQGSLDLLILNKALGVIEKKRNELSETELEYDKLLNDLFEKEIKVVRFIREWLSITPEPGKAPKLPKPELTKKPHGRDARTKVETKVTPEASPQLLTKPKKRIDFGIIEAKSYAERSLQIRNAGGGELKWRYRKSGDWFEVNRIKDGLEVGLTYLDEGDWDGEILIKSNGGDAIIKVHAEIVRPKKKRRPRKKPAEKVPGKKDAKAKVHTEIVGTEVSAEIGPGKWKIEVHDRWLRMGMIVCLQENGQFFGTSGLGGLEYEILGQWSYNPLKKLLVLQHHQSPKVDNIEITGKDVWGFKCKWDGSECILRRAF